MIQKKKLLKYFYRLNEENQELILYEAIELYRQQSKNNKYKKHLSKHYKMDGKIIYVEFRNS